LSPHVSDEERFKLPRVWKVTKKWNKKYFFTIILRNKISLLRIFAQIIQDTSQKKKMWYFISIFPFSLCIVQRQEANVEGKIVAALKTFLRPMTRTISAFLTIVISCR
jgi:hypothetical protein